MLGIIMGLRKSKTNKKTENKTRNDKAMRKDVCWYFRPKL